MTTDYVEVTHEFTVSLPYSVEVEVGEDGMTLKVTIRDTSEFHALTQQLEQVASRLMAV